jgi:hypothetical protein
MQGVAGRERAPLQATTVNSTTMANETCGL